MGILPAEPGQGNAFSRGEQRERLTLQGKALLPESVLQRLNQADLSAGMGEGE